MIEEEFEDTLLIRRRDALAVLVVDGQDSVGLPRVHTAGHHPADVAPTRAAVRRQLGIEAIVLACRRVGVQGSVVHRLLELELLDGHPIKIGFKWANPRSASDPAQHATRDDPSRAPEQPREPEDGRGWTVPGWWARATGWLAREVKAAGLGRVRAVEQIRSWEFSCVLRVRTDHEDLYFKALPYSYSHEPRLAQHLAAHHPTYVPQVVAMHERERWLLMRDCGGHSLESGAPPSAWERAAAAYADLQVASIGDGSRLQALGCRQRGPAELRKVIGPLSDDDAALLGPTKYGLTVQEVQRLRRLRPRLEVACDELAESGLPLTLEHGDLWSSNVYVGDATVAFIDWTDASLSHPFFSLMPFLQSAAWDPALSTVPGVQERLIDEYLERWTMYASHQRLRRTLNVARPLAALHLAVTYWRDIPQPHTQWWMQRMVPFFVRMALEQWDSVEASKPHE